MIISVVAAKIWYLQ